MFRIRKDEVKQITVKKPIIDKMEILEPINQNILTERLKFAAHKVCSFNSDVIITLAVVENENGGLRISKIDFDLRKKYKLLHGNNIPEKLFEIIEKLMNIPFDDSILMYLKEIEKIDEYKDIITNPFYKEMYSIIEEELGRLKILNINKFEWVYKIKDSINDKFDKYDMIKIRVDYKVHLLVYKDKYVFEKSSGEKIFEVEGDTIKLFFDYDLFAMAEFKPDEIYERRDMLIKHYHNQEIIDILCLGIRAVEEVKKLRGEI